MTSYINNLLLWLTPCLDAKGALEEVLIVQPSVSEERGEMCLASLGYDPHIYQRLLIPLQWHTHRYFNNYYCISRSQKL
jgi:hypothetical protein